MAVVIGDYSFSGPFSHPEDVEETQGIYVVLAEDLGDEESEPTAELEIVEVGFANNLRRELIDHEDQDQWSVQYEGRLFAAVMYADEHPNVSVKNVFADIQPGMFAQPALILDPEEEDEEDEDDEDYEDSVVCQLSILSMAVEKVAV
ncbi:MAG TPA: hypothetical protein EYN91_25160 [Candidatus Melainabacteria bacterium]|jgi:hypothetical protein|nr:hypothetical protein [Candidatus Melainabacteria bacterium]HIN66539.1 hypothetical protein [Candidatus Obscuribacterales bacterium]